jgi:glycosyltransferase involved in cell wall biosynthesis
MKINVAPANPVAQPPEIASRLVSGGRVPGGQAQDDLARHEPSVTKGATMRAVVRTTIPDVIGSECELTIVLPCLNEAETLAVCIRKSLESFRRLGIDGEVVVADNGSTDGSQAIGASEGARVVSVRQKGYGAALKGGIEAARGRYVLMADADDSYALDDIDGFLVALESGADLVIGNRFQGGIEPGAMPFLHRWVGNPLLSWLGRLFFNSSLGDFHCGIRAFRREAVQGLGLRTNGMEYASEMVVRASLDNFRVVEVPTVLRPDGRSRRPHLRTWRDGWRHLKFLLAFSPRWLLVYPAMFLLAVGALGLGVLSFGSREFIGVHFSVQTMLACATGVIVGIQALGLSVIARSYATHLDLLPKSARFDRVNRFTSERGVILGTILFLAGVACFVAAILHWSSVGFGRLDVLSTIRLPILAMVMVVAGLQIIMVSFVMSLTNLDLD